MLINSNKGTGYFANIFRYERWCNEKLYNGQFFEIIGSPATYRASEGIVLITRCSAHIQKSVYIRLQRGTNRYVSLVSTI